MKKIDVDVSMKMKAGVTIALVGLPPAIAWLMSAPHENPQGIFITTLLLCVAYVFFLLSSSNFLKVKTLDLKGSLICSIVGGVFGVSFPFFSGGAVYFLINYKIHSFFILTFYIAVMIFLAYVKYKENDMVVILRLAVRKRKFTLVDFSFAKDDFPDFLSESKKKLIFYTLMAPVFLSASIALAFSRSDWKYEVASPLWGGFSLAMLCLMAYGNFISLFYLIHYLCNKEKYVEFKNWPREQFIERG